MRRILTIVALLLCAASAAGQEAERDQSWYRDTLCVDLEREVKSRGGRADCGTEELLIEMDWAVDWKGGIGQAIAYASGLDKRPGLVLVCRTVSLHCEQDWKDAFAAILWLDVPFELWQCEADDITLAACDHTRFGPID